MESVQDERSIAMKPNFSLFDLPENGIRVFFPQTACCEKEKNEKKIPLLRQKRKYLHSRVNGKRLPAKTQNGGKSWSCAWWLLSFAFRVNVKLSFSFREIKHATFFSHGPQPELVFCCLFYVVKYLFTH